MESIRRFLRLDRHDKDNPALFASGEAEKTNPLLGRNYQKPPPAESVLSLASTAPLHSNGIVHEQATATKSDSKPEPRAPAVTLNQHQERTPNLVWAGLKMFLCMLERSTDAFGPLRSAVSGLNECIDNFTRVSNGRKDFENLACRIDELLHDLASHKCVTSSAMTASIKALCITLRDEVEQVKRKLARSVIQGFAGASDDQEEVYECYQRIYWQVNRLQLNASLDMWELLNNDSMDRRLESLSRLAFGAYNSGEADKVKRRSCTEGTCKLQIEKLTTWAYSSSKDRIFWLNGMAGTGKTTLAYTLCEALDKTSRLGASFFCTRVVSKYQDAQVIIPAIAYQLARFSRRFCHFLIIALGSDPDAYRRKLEVQFQKLILEPLKGAQATLPSDFVVVIDALDECDSDSLEVILKLLTLNSSRSNLPVRFLISSRPEPGVCDRLKDAGYGTKLALHNLNPIDMSRDIERYLREELDGVDLTNDQWTSLIKRCGVLFVYASTACRYIKAAHRAKRHKDAIDFVLGLSTASPGKEMKHLDELYSEILDGAFNNQADDETKNVTRRVLETVICAQAPLSLDALAGLLGLAGGGDEAEALLSPFASVIYVTEETRVATILHTSFHDYLKDSEQAQRHYCNVRKRHGELAESCLSRISSHEPQFNVHHFNSSYLLDSQVKDMAQRAERIASSGLLYACMYWVSHLRLADWPIDAMELVPGFLSARLLLWMEVLNVGKQIGDGITMLQQVENWYRASPEHSTFNPSGPISIQRTGTHDKDFSRPISYRASTVVSRSTFGVKTLEDVTALANDAWQFVSVYANHPISRSTPHIYISMLTLWPRDRPIARWYTSRTVRLPLIKGSALSRQSTLLATWSVGAAARSICYHPDGISIVVAVGHSVYILDGTTGRGVRDPLEGHTDIVRSVAVSSNGEMIASGSADNTVRLWDAKTGALILKLDSLFSSQIGSVVFSSNTRTIAEGVPNHPGQGFGYTGHGYPPLARNSCTVLVTDSKRMLSDVSRNLKIEIMDFHIAKGFMFYPHEDQVPQAVATSATCSPDGTHIASVFDDATLRVWNVDTKRMAHGPLKMHRSGVNQALYLPDSRHISSCGDDRTIRIWDAQTGETIMAPLEGHTDVITSIAFSPDSSRLVSCSTDRTVRVWAVPHAGGYDSLSPSHGNWITSARFSSNGAWLVTGADDGSICLWNISTGQLEFGPLVNDTKRIWSVDVSGDGSFIASVSDGGEARLWDMKAKPITSRIVPTDKTVDEPIRVSPGGLELVLGCGDTQQVIYDTAEFLTWPMEKETGSSRLGSHTAQYLYDDVPATQDVGLYKNLDHTAPVARGYSSKQLSLMDFNFSQRVKSRKFPDVSYPCDGLFSVAFSPNGQYAVTGSDDGSVYLWDVESGQKIMGPFEGHNDVVQIVRFTPNGSQFVSITKDNVIRFWAMPNSSELNACKRVENNIASANAGDCDGIVDNTLTRPPGWRLNEHGWVVDSRGRLLIWVPPDLRAYLLRPGNDMLMSSRGSWSLILEGANIGDAWTKCYQPEERSAHIHDGQKTQCAE